MVGREESTKRSRLKEHEAKSSENKNHVGLLIIEKILGRTENRQMPLSELEKSVKQYVDTNKLGSFRNVTGWALNDFLIKNKDEIEIFKRKQVKYVRKRKKQQHSKSDAESKSMAVNDTPLNKIYSPDHFVAQDDEEFTHEAWTEVKPKRKKPKQGYTDSEKSVSLTKNSETIFGKQPTEMMKEKTSYSQIVTGQKNNIPSVSSSDKLHTLLRNGENRDIKFVASPDNYIGNSLRFSLDVVSLWNTPNRSESYIFIGISEKNVLGVGEEFNYRVFDSLFESLYFSHKPVFKTFLMEYQAKYICVIEIANSAGHGSPSIVQRDLKRSDGIVLNEREVWFRLETLNVVCKPNEMSEIFQWFLEAHSPKVVGQSLDCKPPQPVKNAGTNTAGIEDSGSEDDPLCLSGDSFRFFWEAVKHFRRGHCVLIAGDISCDRKCLEAFAKIPLICVYDFDIQSYSDGLLNAVYDKLETRHLSLSCWNESPENISERGTRWCFMRGRQEMSSSRTDLKDGGFEDLNIWYKLVKKGVQSYCEKLANFAEDYTVPTILFIWPANEKYVPFMTKFLFCLNDILTSTPNVVLCMHKQPETKSGRLKFQTLCEDFGNNISICNISIEEMCRGIQSHSASRERDGFTYELPKRDNFEALPISETDASWLREDFEVLFLNNPYVTSNITEEDIKSEVTNFSKGGTLPWYVWYSGEADKSVADRDARKELEEKIGKHLEDYKTSMITLCHAPGSGGTTLAQATLWRFRSKIPCVHLKLRTSSLLDELDRKVSFLHEKTDLPVLLLIDGEEESKVRRLSRRLKYTVILYVKRYPYKVPQPPPEDRVYLSGYVSASESKELAEKLGKTCGESRKRNRLEEFTSDIESKRSRHLLYEYGMTVYLHEFKGIMSYVKGYLEMENSAIRELTPVQKCLGYLSLVYYYGQTCVPCQFFAGLFNKPPNYNMTLEDFPSPIQEFVVYDKNEGKRNNIRICHYIIAKEILEQILYRNANKSDERTDTLGIRACRNLSKFCIDFIEYASKKKTKVSALSTTVRFILTKTFIFRDEKDMGDNEEQVRKRPVLSKLMIDIPAGKPLFTERLKVLKKLTESFPDDPNFCAHLGRFHAFCRPDEENEAEKCFQRAMKLCEDQVRGKRDEDIEEGMKLTMMHIYHMYGIVKQRFISKYTGRNQKEKVVAFSAENIFNERIETLVPIAETACEYFTKSRNITPENHDVYTYAYTGEIQTRLQICDFVNRHFQRGGKGSTGLSEFLNSDADIRCRMFVHRSISAIEKLILECYMDVELFDSDLRTLRSYVVWYNGLFKKQVLSFEELSQGDEVSNRRLQIATKKVNAGKADHLLSGVETIDDGETIEEIVKLYEANFSDIEEFGFQEGDGKKELERDYRDWIFAIRHEKFRQNYTLEEVLVHVRNWNDKSTVANINVLPVHHKQFVGFWK